MPTLESRTYVAASRPEAVISTAQGGWQRQVGDLMRRKRRFALETSCPSFDPSGFTALSIRSWITGKSGEVAGCAWPAVAGLALILAALVDPEPYSRLLLAGLGCFGIWLVARTLAPIITACYHYNWRVSFQGDGQTYVWMAEPLE